MPTYYGNPSDEMLTTPDEMAYSPESIQAGAMGAAIGSPYAALPAAALTANETTPTGNAEMPPAPVMAPPPKGLVNIGPKQWLENVAGPVPLDRRGISMKGGGPYVPEQMSGSYAEYLRQKDAFDRENRLAAIAANAPLGQAEQAVNRALRLEAQLNLASDIKSGMPTYQALAKNFAGLNAGATGPQMAQAGYNLKRMAPVGPPELFNIGGQQFVRGANLHPLSRQMPMGQPGEPLTATEIRSKDGEVLGHYVPGVSGAIHVKWTGDKDQLTKYQEFVVAEKVQQHNEKILADAERNLNPADPNASARLNSLRESVKKGAEELRSLGKKEKSLSEPSEESEQEPKPKSKRYIYQGGKLVLKP